MNHLNKVIIAYSLFALASPATAMTVSDFLPKAEKLMSASMGAMFSKHRKPVAAEMAKVTSGYRADIEAAQRAGRKSSSCPPKKGSVNGKEFLTYLQSIPLRKAQLTS